MLNTPATLKFSCFGKLPNGVATNADDIKFTLSPLLKFKLNASSDPINTFFFLNFFTSPLTIFFSKNSLIFFSS